MESCYRMVISLQIEILKKDPRSASRLSSINQLLYSDDQIFEKYTKFGFR